MPRAPRPRARNYGRRPSPRRRDVPRTAEWCWPPRPGGWARRQARRRRGGRVERDPWDRRPTPARALRRARAPSPRPDRRRARPAGSDRDELRIYRCRRLSGRPLLIPGPLPRRMISLTKPAICRDYAQPDVLCPMQARHGIAAPCKRNRRRHEAQPALSRGLRERPQEEAVSRSRDEIGREPRADIVGNDLGRAGLGVAQSAQAGEPLRLAGNVIGHAGEGLPSDDDLGGGDFGQRIGGVDVRSSRYPAARY